MSVLGAIFGRRNTIDRLSTQDLRKERVTLEVQEQKLGQQLRKLDADADKFLKDAATGSGSDVDDRIAARRIVETKSKRNDVERQAQDVSQKLSALGRISRAKDRQKELEQKGLWSKISKMSIDDLDDTLTGINIQDQDMRVAVGQINDILGVDEQTVAAEDPSELRDVVEQIQAARKAESD